MAEDKQHRLYDQPIVLTDKRGVERECKLIQLLKVDKQDYAILLPLHAVEIAVYTRIDQKDGEDVLVEVDDPEEWE